MTIEKSRVAPDCSLAPFAPENLAGGGRLRGDTRTGGIATGNRFPNNR